MGNGDFDKRNRFYKFMAHVPGFSRPPRDHKKDDDSHRHGSPDPGPMAPMKHTQSDDIDMGNDDDAVEKSFETGHIFIFFHTYI